jgi:hypothetical protein
MHFQKKDKKISFIPAQSLSRHSDPPVHVRPVGGERWVTGFRLLSSLAGKGQKIAIRLHEGLLQVVKHLHSAKKG